VRLLQCLVPYARGMLTWARRFQLAKEAYAGSHGVHDLRETDDVDGSVAAETLIIFFGGVTYQRSIVRGSLFGSEGVACHLDLAQGCTMDAAGRMPI
jgi:hypothetical protein